MTTLTRLYLTRHIHKSRPCTYKNIVSDASLSDFVELTAKPLFNGFTQMNGWHFQDGERQKCTILEFLHSGSPADWGKIGLIARTYATEFEQESVMTTSQDSVVVVFEHALPPNDDPPGLSGTGRTYPSPQD